MPTRCPPFGGHSGENADARPSEWRDGHPCASDQPSAGPSGPGLAAARPSWSAASSRTGSSDSLPRSSIFVIFTRIFWPTESTSSTFSTRLPPASLRTSLTCSSPSLPGRSETNAPNVASLTTVPRNCSPTSGLVRVGDRVDLGAGGLGRRAVDRADVDGAVLLDRDVRAGLVLDRVDRLALGADQLADLVDRDLDADHAGRGRRHLVGAVDRGVEDAEDRRGAPPWPAAARPSSTDDGMPSSFVSSWIAVTNSLVPATLKSMSPSASSAPRMSVRAA